MAIFSHKSRPMRRKVSYTLQDGEKIQKNFYDNRTIPLTTLQLFQVHQHRQWSPNRLQNSISSPGDLHSLDLASSLTCILKVFFFID